MVKLIRNLPIAVKILLISLNYIFFILIVGFVSINALWNVNDNLQELNEEELRSIYELQEARIQFRDISSLMSSYIMLSDENERNTVINEMLSSERLLMDNIKIYKSHNNSDIDTKMIGKLMLLYDEFKDLQGRIQQKKADNSNISFVEMKNNAGIIVSEAENCFKALIDLHKKDSDALYKISQEEFGKIVTIFTVIVLISIAIGAFVSLFIYRVVAIPLNTVTKRLSEISQDSGDLTNRLGVESKDEIGHLSNAIDSLMDKLENMVRNIRGMCDSIAKFSAQLSSSTGDSGYALEQIATVTQSIALRSQENFTTVKETQKSLQVVEGFAKSTADAATNTRNNSQEVEGLSEKGAELLNGVSDSVYMISKTSKKVAASITEVNESSQKISNIAYIITGISAQTNLLALNAAIEAARAGEAGRGFSVVAEEIRKLADESASAGRAINSLIDENKLISEKAVSSSMEVCELIEMGVENVNKARESFETILLSIKGIIPQIQSINDATQKQVTITSDIGKTIQNISVNAEQVAADTEATSASVEEQLAITEEISATSIELSNMSETLRSIVKGYRVH